MNLIIWLNILKLLFTCELKLSLNKWSPTRKIFKWNEEWIMESRFELMTFDTYNSAQHTNNTQNTIFYNYNSHGMEPI
jgi:hypothetical protein